MKLSTLPKTWILDIDGTLLRHNGYLNDGDEVLDGVKDFFSKLNKQDKVILLTARSKENKQLLEDFLRSQGIVYDALIFDVPMGERILVNDEKPSGLKTAYAVNKKRDEPLQLDFQIDPSL